MRRERAFIVGFVCIFLVCGVLIGLFGARGDFPFDSRSNEPDGLRALYLTLEELGFLVGRKTGPIEKTQGGSVLVFGEEYLKPEDSDALRTWMEGGGAYLSVEDPWIYTNGNIEFAAADVWRLTAKLWPYREGRVWFDEYGRGFPAPEGEAPSLTPVSILPTWVFLPLLQLALLCILCLPLYRSRLGPALRAERGKRRDQREDTQALAQIMERSGLLSDALRLCYSRLCQSTRQEFPHLKAACDVQPGQHEKALALAEEMDRIVGRAAPNAPL